MRISSVERPSSGFLSILLQKRVLMVSCREAICADAAAPFSKEHGIKVAGIIGRVFLFTHRRHLHIALRIDLLLYLASSPISKIPAIFGLVSHCGVRSFGLDGGRGEKSGASELAQMRVICQSATRRERERKEVRERKRINLRKIRFPLFLLSSVSLFIFRCVSTLKKG